VPLLGIDKRLVEAFQDIGLDVPEAEARRLSGNAAHKIRAGTGGQRPVEEVRFHHAGDAGLHERAAVKKVLGRRHVEAEYVDGHGLGDNCEIGVLEEQVVSVDR